MSTESRTGFPWVPAFSAVCANAVLVAGVFYWKWNLLWLFLATAGELLVITLLHLPRLRSEPGEDEHQTRRSWMIGLPASAVMLALIAWAFVDAVGTEPLKQAVVPGILLAIAHAPAVLRRADDAPYAGPYLRAWAAGAGLLAMLVAVVVAGGIGHIGHNAVAVVFISAKGSVETLGIVLTSYVPEEYREREKARQP